MLLCFLVVLLILAPCFKPNSVIGWSHPEVYFKRWMDLCVVLVGFGFPPPPFWGLRWHPGPTPTIWAAFDKNSLWYCQVCCSVAPLTDMDQLEPEYTDANTVEHWCRRVNTSVRVVQMSYAVYVIDGSTNFYGTLLFGDQITDLTIGKWPLFQLSHGQLSRIHVICAHCWCYI